MSDTLPPDSLRTAPETAYPLLLREGGGRFFFRLRNQGVRLTQDALAWVHDGQQRRYGFAEILSIRLQVRHVHKSGDIGACEIRFRDGRSLKLDGGTAYGYADEAQSAAYAAFIRDLHARLAASGVTTIRYLAGSSEGMHTGAVVSVVIGALFFIGLPFVLLFIVRRWEVLGVLAAGVGFIWPLWSKLEANRPRDYAPDAIPAELVP
jgi:hypothetical protein